MTQSPQLTPGGSAHGPAPIWNPEVPGGGAATLFMAGLITFMLLALTAFFLYLRWRARHPLDAPSSPEDLDYSGRDGEDRDDRPKWQRREDWWNGRDEP